MWPIWTSSAQKHDVPQTFTKLSKTDTAPEGIMLVDIEKQAALETFYTKSNILQNGMITLPEQQKIDEQKDRK